MQTTNGYWVLRILKCGERVTPIMPNSDCVKRFATENDAWEALSEIKADGMHPYFVRCDNTTGGEYRIAYVAGGGEWDVVDTFTATDDDAANTYAEATYSGGEWFVLDNTGRNINGGAR